MIGKEENNNNNRIVGGRKRCEDFEEIFEVIGSEGRYQKILLYGVLCPIVALSPFMILNMVFMWDVPDHWCHVPGKDPSFSLEDWKNLSLPKEIGPDGVMHYSKCKMYERNSPGSVAVSCQYGWEYDTTDYDATVSSEFNYVCERDHYATEFFTYSSVGSAIGSAVFGVMADKKGRKPIFFLAIVTNVLFKSASLLVAQDYQVYKLFQLLSGLASSTIRVMPELIIAEVCGASYRPWIYTVSWLLWVVGNSIMPYIAMACRNWLLFGMISAFPGILLFSYYPIIDESPRWLLSVGKTKEAMQIIFKIANRNGKIVDQKELEKMVDELATKQMKERESEPVRVCSLFSKSRLAKNMFVLTILWSVNNLLYDGVTLNTTKMAGNQFVNYFLIALIELPGGWLAGKLVEVTGRRWTQVGFFLLSGVAGVAGGVASAYPNYTVFVIVASLGIKFGVSVTELISYLQGAEIFPTQLRSTGIGLASTMASTMSIFGPYIVYSGKIDVSLPYLILCICSFLGMVAAAFLPETFQQNLPETVDDANCFGKQHKFWSYLPQSQDGKKKRQSCGGDRV